MSGLIAELLNEIDGFAARKARNSASVSGRPSPFVSKGTFTPGVKSISFAPKYVPGANPSFKKFR